MFNNHISTVLKQALTTFSTKHDHFYQNMEILKVLLHKTKAEDVNLDPQFMSDELWQRPRKAPVTYIDLFEDDNVTMGIFVLKPNMKLPLHNHPAMYGLIKVIAGKTKVTSYSINTERTLGIDRMPIPVGASMKLFTAERRPDVHLSSSSECCVLEPEMCNLHEIESVDGPAAFIDILAPPYETIVPDLGTKRQCSYFSVLREVAPDLYKLQETPSPSWYWSDSFAYSGPPLY